MTPGTRSLATARCATVQLCGHGGAHGGQGLLLDLPGAGAVVLTCHHVVAPLGNDAHVVVRGDSAQAGQLLPARYCAHRSRPSADVAVLHVDGVHVLQRPLLHALNPDTYTGELSGLVTGLTWLSPDNFNAKLGQSTRLVIPATVPGPWPEGPRQYQIPRAFRLAYPTDARPGISGAVVIYEEGVLGLAHFARAAGPGFEREVFLVPLEAWVPGCPELGPMIEPLVDARLRNAAMVKPAHALEAGKDLVIAGYRPEIHLRRDAEHAARAALNERGGVLILGRPGSGKTRLALTLLQEHGDVLVVIPRLPRPPEAFEVAGLSGLRAALFVDDLHRQPLGADPLEWRRRFEEATGHQCLLLAMSRDGEEWRTVLEQQPGIARLADELRPDALILTSRGEQGGEDVSPDEAWTLAKDLGLDRREFVRRFDGTVGSLILDLTAMGERYRRLRSEQRGAVAMSRLLDSARLLYEARRPSLPLTVLRAVAEQIRGNGAISAEVWEDLLRRTSEEGFGYFGDDEFRVYAPYLERCVDYHPARAELEKLLPLMTGLRDADGLLSLGIALRDLGSDIAADAFLAALREGNAHAYVFVGGEFERRGKTAEAERMYRLGADAGDARGYWLLGALLMKQPGRIAEAEILLKKAIAAGGSIAYIHLAYLLMSQPGRQADAEAAWRCAVNAGWPELNTLLGALLAGLPGREADAEQAYRDALKQPLNRGMTLYNLGLLLARQPGREAEAEDAFRAVEADEPEALFSLGNLLARQRGREADAEAAYRQAGQAGDPRAYFNLGGLLETLPERKADAEAVYRDAIGAGLTDAYDRLGALLMSLPDRRADAEAALQQAILSGSDIAHYNLGVLLSDQPTRLAEAEQEFRSALAAGVAEAELGLGLLLAQQPERRAEGCEHLRRARSLGFPQAAKAAQRWCSGAQADCTPASRT